METRFTYKIVIPEEERLKFKILAKSKGMTISGYLAQLIKKELNDYEALSASPIHAGESIRNSTLAIGDRR